MNLPSETVPQIPMTLTFTPPEDAGGKPLWVFDPPSVTVDPRQTTIVVITLVAASSAPLSATFVTPDALTWVPPAPPLWAVSWWLNNPTELDIKSINQGPNAKGTWGFQVTVRYDKARYTSPDPTIINIEPTGGVETLASAATIRAAAREVAA